VNVNRSRGAALVLAWGTRPVREDYIRIFSKVSLFLKSVAILACGLLVGACAGLPSAAEIAIKDSGVQVARGMRIYWLNDHEVLFGGPTEESRVRKDSVAEPINRVSVWNIRTNQVTRFGELAGSLCYHEGYIVFWERDVPTNRLWINYGKLGETTRQERGPAQGEFDPVTCRPIKDLPPRPEWTQGLAIRWLRSDHGFLVLGAADPKEAMKNTPIQFCSNAERASCVELPIKQRESRGFEWVPFKKAYFVVGHYFQVDSRHPRGGFNRSPWPLGAPLPAWWLYPDGRVEQLLLPPGRWLEYFVYPSSVGFLTVGAGPSAFEQSLYLIQDDKGVSIVHGLIQTPAVSPDGCRIAINHDPQPLKTNARNNSHVTLKIIELCQGS
jgi:hypothetical protein